MALRKGRGAWKLLRTTITRRFRLRSNTHLRDASRRTEQAVQGAHHPHDTHSTPSSDIHVTAPAGRETICSDPDGIVHQLALLAANGSRSSPQTTISSSKRSSTPMSAKTQTMRPGGGGNSQEYTVEDVESFLYLRSLITISCLPQSASSGQQQTTIKSSLEGVKEKQSPGRKRASSRLSLRLADLPGLSFPKVPRKPCPRYSPLPPMYSPKPGLVMRPEVRF